jgi:hypothetical protein
MKSIKWLVAFLALATLGGSAAWAHGGGRVHFGVVIGNPYWGPWGYPPPPYYYYPPYYPPIVVERQAPVYIEQAPAAVATPAPAAAPAPQNFWYYCAAGKGYYPYVKECPGGWQKVLPQPQE